MKILIGVAVSLLLSLSIVPFPGHADSSADGDALLDTILPLPPDVHHQQYLGLTGSEGFKISQIKSEIVIIEIFSMY